MTAIDQADRDRIRSSLHESLFIQAGAGTGKTRSLIERLEELVASGVELRSVAAITFTESAAAELKDRLRRAIETNTAAAEGSPAADLWRRAQEQLDAAAIQTLHAFAQRILASHPLEAGLPPGFRAMDAVQSALAFDERWERFLDDFLGDDGPADLVEAFMAMSGNFDDLRKAALAMHASWDRLEYRDDQPGERPSVDLAGVLDALEAIAGCAGQNNKPDSLSQSAAAAPPLIDALKRAPNFRATLQLLKDAKFRRGAGRKGNWPPGVLEGAREAIEDYGAQRDELIAAVSTWAATRLLSTLARLVLEYAAERRRAGTLEFQDLLVLARDLLRSDDGVRRAVNARYTHVLIDEFQDTDPLQIDIASLVVRPSDCLGNVPWHDAPVPPGALVVVGDPKQSIYRFRRADINLYLVAATGLRSEAVGLVQNWRSVPSLVDWINYVFEQLIGTIDDPERGQPAYVALQPGRDGTAGEPSVRWFGREFNYIDEARAAEAEALAIAVLAARQQQWPVHDRSAGGPGHRPARLSDIAILFPRRSILPFVEREFEERGIPYRVESRSLLYETQDVSDLVHILAAIVDPTDDVSVVAALRSPALACSDQDLFDWNRARGKWDYTAATPQGLDVEHPVLAAMGWLHDIHEAVERLAVNEVVERVILDRRLLELAFAYRRPRERWQRYRFVLEQSRAFAAQPGASLRGFVSWMRRQADERADVVESAIPEPDDDAVRLMTVHASQGLDVPIVALAGLGQQLSVQVPRLIWDDDGAPQIELSDLVTPGFEEVKEREKARESAERQRLLYVAATRARDHLLVSLFRTSKPSHASNLAAFLDDPATPWEELSLDVTVESPGPLPPPLPMAEPRDAWLERRRRVVNDRSRGKALAATSVARDLAVITDPPPPVDETMDETRPWKRGRAGTSIGRAVHAVLQTIDLATGEGIAAAARAQSVAEGVAGREHEIETLVRAARGSGAVTEALSGGRYWRELFVSANVGRHLLEGFIDLLYERPDGLVVVDYKTDAVRPGDEMDDAVRRYQYQAAAYAIALEQSLGRTVSECRFVFAHGNTAEDRVVPDLPTVRAQLLERLQLDLPLNPRG